jgi:KaiC/GvpD/RAD55 family RecA-like ATPase
MDYDIAIDSAPHRIPGGTAVLLLHPSTAATDRIDTGFLKTDTDHFLVISTRTTAREVKQKLDHYDVDPERAVILDTLSVERGYSRRSADNIHYVSSPDDVEGVLQQTERFLADHDGKHRVSFDSISELAYYGDEDAAVDALERMGALLDEYDAVGLFHVDEEVHDEATVERFREAADGVVDLAEDGSVTADF